MANRNLDLPPSQQSGSAPGASDAQLARLLTLKLPAGPAPRGAPAPQRLAAAIARLPTGGMGKHGRQMFLP